MQCVAESHTVSALGYTSPPSIHVTHYIHHPSGADSHACASLPISFAVSHAWHHKEVLIVHHLETKHNHVSKPRTVQNARGAPGVPPRIQKNRETKNTLQTVPGVHRVIYSRDVAYLHNCKTKGLIQGRLHKGPTSVGYHSVHLAISDWILLSNQPSA